MDNTQKNLIELFAFSAFGKEYSLTADFDLGDIFNLAKNLNIWPNIFFAVKDMYKKGLISISEDTFSTINNAFLLNATKYAKRKNEAHKVIENLNKNGIETIILKGETLSHLYKIPELRTSSDTDILINEDDEEKALKILNDMKIDIERKSSVSHHTKCTSEKTGLIEIHTNIYEDYVDMLYFNNFEISKNNLVEITTSDGFRIKALSIKDGLYFNTFHYIKHFLGRGATLKQVSDLILYIKSYDINFDEYMSNLKTLGYDKLIRATLGIGIMHFGLNKEELYNIDFNAENSTLLLDDIILSGDFGKAKDENKRISDEFLKLKLKDDYIKYKASFSRALFLKSASFKIKNIYSKYNYVRKYKYLIPVAYVHHIFYIIGASLKKVFANKNKYSIKEIESRLNLFEKLL